MGSHAWVLTRIKVSMFVLWILKLENLKMFFEPRDSSLEPFDFFFQGIFCLKRVKRRDLDVFNTFLLFYEKYLVGSNFVKTLVRLDFFVSFIFFTLWLMDIHEHEYSLASSTS